MVTKKSGEVTVSRTGTVKRMITSTTATITSNNQVQDQGGSVPIPLGMGGTPTSTPNKGSHRGQVGTEVELAKKLCREMNQVDRKQVRDYITYLDREAGQAKLLGGRKGQELDRDEAMWVASVEKYLDQALGSSMSSNNRGPATLGAIQGSFAIVHRFLQDTGMHRDASYDRKAVYDLLADYLVTYSRNLAGKIGAPLGFKFVLGQTEKVPGLFDRAYPGYAEAGLAGIVVDQLLKSKPRE